MSTTRPASSTTGPTASWRRLAALPSNFFAIPFGLGGLAVSWRAAEPILALPHGVADGLFLLASVAWGVLVFGLVARLLDSPSTVGAELRDPVLSPFTALPGLVLLVLAAGLLPHAAGPAKVTALIAVAIVIALGGWLTGQWIAGELDTARLHPAYFLPTVAGGFLGANVAALAGHRTIAWLCFGIGTISWMQIGSTILNRLFLGPPLAAALVPTLAIEVAPPAVAGNAYFALHHGPDDVVTYALAGFCVLMVLVQVRLLPLYRAAPFAATFWSFTFSYTAVATYALNWIGHGHPGHERLLAWVTLVAITALVAAIAACSLRAVAAGRFFPVA
ncbi:MAG TPA: hypothetical protein VGO71_03675 [Baekduia sp.]|nr:hypothetical protein [Baekduia sp.]